MTLMLSVSMALVSSSSYAIEGVPYVGLTIHGKFYDVPIPNPKVENDYFLLLKATKGDKDAQEFLLGNKTVRWLYIGDESVRRWCKITKDDITVQEVG